MLEFPIVRSKRRTVGIYMKPDGSFEVRAPYHLPEKQIDAFVLSKLSWITEKQTMLRKQSQERANAGLKIPEAVPLLGEDRPVLVDPSGSSPRWRDGAFLLTAEDPEKARAQIVSLCRVLAKRELPAITAHWARFVGQAPSAVKIGEARTSWGRCTSEGEITFSWRLMAAPLPCVDYVVVHELCHLTEFNHSPAFWALVERQIPDWRERREELHALARRLSAMCL